MAMRVGTTAAHPYHEQAYEQALSGRLNVTSTKDNLGATFKRRRRRHIIIVGLGGLLCYSLVRVLYQAPISMWWVEEYRPQESHLRNHHDSMTTTKKYDAVLEGRLTLIDVRIAPSGLEKMSSRYEAKATFCKIEWELQQQNPSNVPMFRDLQAQSILCPSTTIIVDLFDVVKAAKKHDHSPVTDGDVQIERDSFIHSIPPVGVVFHETRCGSTLFANLMAAFSPEHSRVYSESPPPIAALRACDVMTCNESLHHQLIQDVFYMMGRTASTKTPQYVFYKIQSIGTLNIDKFAAAMPNVPWVFLYRNSVEVMQSHLATKSFRGSGKPVCARNFGGMYQPRTTLQVIQSTGRKIRDLTMTEYCAAHLAGLSLAAINEHEKTQKGRFVNYRQMPDVVWNDILPNHFQIAVSKIEIGRMEKVSLLYSKGRGMHANKAWQDDAAKKRDTALSSVLKAADVFAKEVFDKMEKLSQL